MNFQLEYLISMKMMFLGHLRLAKDELISTKNWAKQMSLRILLTVNRLVILNPYLMINIIHDQHHPGSNFHRVRVENPSKIIFRQINIDSIRNMFDLLRYNTKNEIDTFVISETKIDNSFPISQFIVTGSQALSCLIGHGVRVEYFHLSDNLFLVKQLKLNTMLISRNFLWRSI